MGRSPAATGPYREAPPSPPPPRPPLLGVAGVALVCALLLRFTTNKLDDMARLRGEAPGLPPRAMTLVRELRRFNGGAAVYQLADERGGLWEIQRSARQMARDRLRYGDVITVRCLDAERACYLRDSVYVSDGNVSFDRTLQALELAGLLCSLGVLARRVARWRRALRLHR